MEKISSFFYILMVIILNHLNQLGKMSFSGGKFAELIMVRVFANGFNPRLSYTKDSINGT